MVFLNPILQVTSPQLRKVRTESKGAGERRDVEPGLGYRWATAHPCYTASELILELSSITQFLFTPGITQKTLTGPQAQEERFWGGGSMLQ